MASFEHARSRRRERYERLFSARALCAAGLAVMPALLFNPGTVSRILQFLFFWFLAWLAGRKTNPVSTVLVILGIALFNLLTPYGRVLFSIGAFKITAGALAAGIRRAVTLEGLIMLSRAAVRRDLRIPGAFGGLLGESFRIFSLAMSRKPRITRKNLIADIDRMLLDLSEDDPADAGNADPRALPAERTRPLGFVLLAGVTLIAWLPWALPLASSPF